MDIKKFIQEEVKKLHKISLLESEKSKIQNKLNLLKEDWGSSDQTAMNRYIHEDLGQPTTPPSPVDVMQAAESAVDYYWDEWPEYRTDRDDLIAKATRYYYRAYFKEFAEKLYR